MYFCLGGHQDNVMCLREIDWLTTVNNREISLVLLSTLSVVSCIRHNIYFNGEDVIHNLHIPCALMCTMWRHIARCEHLTLDH